MKVLPRPHNLPGTDPQFHEARKYLSPMTYKGREILASHGSCKQEGCGYHSAWTSNKARDLGMWKHRALKVVHARIRYFGKVAQGDVKKIGILLRETADHHTHLFEPWLQEVKVFLNELAGVGVDDLADVNFQVEYDLGNSAYDVAKAALDRGYN